MKLVVMKFSCDLGTSLILLAKCEITIYMQPVSDLPEMLCGNNSFFFFFPFFSDRERKHSPVGEVRFFCFFCLVFHPSAVSCVPKISAVMSLYFFDSLKLIKSFSFATNAFA